MKRILLASTAVVAFAGAAAAAGDTTVPSTGVELEADFKFGYNDEYKHGFYWSAGLDFLGKVALDHGLQAGFSAKTKIVDAKEGSESGAYRSTDVEVKDYEFFLTAPSAGLYLGKTDVATKLHYKKVDGMEASFRKAGDYIASKASDTKLVDDGAVIRGEFGTQALGLPVDANIALSYVIDLDDTTGNNDLKALHVAAGAEFGMFTVALGYEQGDRFNDVIVDKDPTPPTRRDVDTGSAWGISVGTTFGGADIRLAYLNREADNIIAYGPGDPDYPPTDAGFKAKAAEESWGVSVAYPFGPVTTTVFYSANDPSPDKYGFKVDYVTGPLSVKGFATISESSSGKDDFGVEGSYDFGSGLKFYAGVVNKGLRNDSATYAWYLATKYNLGSGAELLASYAQADTDYTGDRDEIGAQKLYEGTTVQISFEF